jgi:hypothetical protein
MTITTSSVDVRSTGPRLPDEFADLESYAQDWVLPTTEERYQRRLQSTMGEMQAFYDAVLARGDAIFAHLDQFDYPDLPQRETNLLWLLCSLSAVGFAIDVFRQPEVLDSAGASLPVVVEPTP